MSAEEKNKLDELFKNRLGNPDTYPEYNDQDWDDLVQMLDAGKKPRGVIYWLPRLGAVAAMLLLFLGWWMFKPEKIEVKPTAAIKQQPVQVPANVKSDSAVANIAKATSPQTNSATPANGSITTAGAKLAGPTTPVYAAAKITHKAQPINNNTGNHTVMPNNTAIVNIPQNDVLAKADVKPGNNSTGAVTTADNAAVGARTDNNTVASAGTQQAIQGNNVTSDNTEVAPVKKPKVSNAAGFKPQIGLAIMASPDVNGVGSFQNAKVGTNIGMLLSVGVTKKLSISTGAVYAKKPYLTDFADYYAGYKFKTDPQDVYADCRVLDIPLNIDYKLYNKSHNSFSIGSGLSSYLMLKEKYTYNYAVPGTAGPASYSVTNKNRHYFGVLNLNATYEHQLNTKFSVAAQPYLKVPLTDIGNGRVKLQSAGVALGVRWNLSRSATP